MTERIERVQWYEERENGANKESTMVPGVGRCGGRAHAGRGVPRILRDMRRLIRPVLYGAGADHSTGEGSKGTAAPRTEVGCCCYFKDYDARVLKKFVVVVVDVVVVMGGVGGGVAGGGDDRGRQGGASTSQGFFLGRGSRVSDLGSRVKGLGSRV
eukprot:2804237-Rhodomonas_salina.2